MVSLYTIEIAAEEPGDIVTSPMYDWWFYATPLYRGYPTARRVSGSSGTDHHDRMLPSDYAKSKDWPSALHGYVAMYEWGSIFHPTVLMRPSAKVHMPLHELAHRVDKVESGLSDEVLIEMIKQKERSLVGYTRGNPFTGEHNASPR